MRYAESKTETPFTAKELPLLMLLFTLGGIIGFFYEEICVYINDGVFYKRGTTFGPWIPIYGIGCLFVYSLTKRLRSKPLYVFLIGALSCGALELAAGFMLDRFFHLRLWNYSIVIMNWGNVNGYICFRSVITWGLFSLLLMSAILPLCEHFRHKHPKVINAASITLFALFMTDILVSFSKGSYF